ncbi:MAG TPA: hypothetical protein VIA06_13130 [Candidatus Dormibacteraeota bacterium]|jgi:hypothetical protein|nr:hypothetical protein [Candidatus Dormibacteraeota bacterium]
MKLQTDDLRITAVATYVLLAVDAYDKNSAKPPQHIKKRSLDRLRAW